MAIDPGPEKSAWVLYDGKKPCNAGIAANMDLCDYISGPMPPDKFLAVEMIASYGMPVGAEVFETCVWIGRFIESHNGDHAKIYRKDVKLHLCQSPRAKDANVRQALIDRFGGKEKAIGKKKTPGPLYGFHDDMWAALAVAVTYADNFGGEK